MLFIWALVVMSKATGDASDWNFDYYWVFLCIMGGLMTFVPVLTLKMRKVSFEVRNAMKRVCDEDSNKYPLMTFQIRFESTLVGGSGAGEGDAHVRTYNFIEVEMAPSAVPTKPVEGQFTGIPMMCGPIVMGGVVANPTMTSPQPTQQEQQESAKKSPAQLRAELDTLKEYITDEEYATKKADFLSEV